jgi:hypothetical protein
VSLDAVAAVPTGTPLADEKSLQQTLALVVTNLRGADVTFALMGGCGIYARGGPPTTHDVDVLVCEEDAQRARDALVAVGMTPVDPPEDWLTKAVCGDWLVDIIFRPNERPCTPETLALAEDVRVGSITAPVMPASVLIIDKLLVMGPHRCDFTEVLPAARALREQVNWDEVRSEVSISPYAEAFLFLADRLGITPPPDPPTDPPTDPANSPKEQ